MNEERRRRTRVKVNFTATFHVPGQREIPIETLDISLNGMFVRAHSDLVPGIEGTVILHLSPAIAVKIEGKVVRVAGKELAIGFTAIDEEAFPHLKRIVAYNAGDADLIDEELKRAGFIVKEE